MISGTLFAVILSVCIILGASGPVPLQSLIVERVTEGHTAQLECIMRNATVTHTDIHWYRQEPGSHVKLLSICEKKNPTQWCPELTNRIWFSRDPSRNSALLTITNVQPNDTGVYYCSVQGGIYGSGSLLFLNSTNGPVLLQSPSLGRVTEGQTAQLQCTMRNTTVTHTDVHWYRLSPEHIMEWVLTHPGNVSTQWSPEFNKRFQPFRDSSNNSFILNITDVQPNDTGVYYCSVWEWIYGSGSQLIVDTEER
ncbi:immunoglobulin superfamily member 3-like [Chiloscyllium plagiosum]|uniref:immunoglobulin superfamily member 3-like n=1 Tax=Chiloscyllium plagiosum TaxID=36176 RepID=UPI001CB81F07|nr:immunoglobulin superfamily member 3-like [Chiloscyllium plagiosum]